jgi:CARDB
LSFFDEADEPRTTARAAGRSRRPRSGGRRPPDRHTIRVRQGVALSVIVVFVILIVLGVSSCENNARINSLKDYTNNVASLVQSSDQLSTQFFGLLTGAQPSSNLASVQSQLNQTRLSAQNQLSRVRGLSVPGAMSGAQQDMVLTFQMRRDGIANIAQQIQPALSTSVNQGAINGIAVEMARLYASDAVYKDYAAPQIAAALHGNGIAVGPPDGETIAAGQFLPDLRWMTPSFVASRLHVVASGGATSTTKPAPGIHGHEMDGCTVGGTALSTSSTNTIPATPTPTFACTITNDGQNKETNVTVKVTVQGTSISGQAVIPTTSPGNQYTAQVTLSSSPPAGSYTVSATVERVPGETTVTHNTKTFPVSFQ